MIQMGRGRDGTSPEPTAFSRAAGGRSSLYYYDLFISKVTIPPAAYSTQS